MSYYSSSITLPLDLIGIVASYANVETLASLDLTCRDMRQHTHEGWAACARSQFGSSRRNGKDAWRAGVALTGEPGENYVTRLDHYPESYSNAFTGSTTLAQNESIVVFCSDQHEHERTPPPDNSDNEDAQMRALLPEHPIQVRDAKSLDVLYHFEGGARVWEVAICGPVGKEFIVICTVRDVICFYGPNHEESLTLYSSSSVQETKLLGKDDALIVFREGRIFVHQPKYGRISGSNDQFSIDCVWQTHVRQGANPDDDFECGQPAWSADSTQFAYSAIDNQISIWNLYDQSSSLSSLINVKEQSNRRTVHPSPSQELKAAHPIAAQRPTFFRTVAFNQYLAAGTLEGIETITVFDRSTGIRLYTMMDTIGPARFFGADNVQDFTPAIDLEISGYYLISASVQGCVLGVWDLRTGKPSYRTMMEHFLGAHGWDYPSHMVRLSAWSCHAFLITTPTGEMALWAFPQSQHDEADLAQIAAREASRRGILSTSSTSFDDGEDVMAM
jgi:WD40 repeat protein